MSKSVVKRIRYYSRKANQYSAARYDVFMRRTDKTIPATRLERLNRYKAMLNQIIASENNQ